MKEIAVDYLTQMVDLASAIAREVSEVDGMDDFDWQNIMFRCTQAHAHLVEIRTTLNGPPLGTTPTTT